MKLKSLIKPIITAIFLIGPYIFLTYADIYYHEQAHVQIGKKHGCTEWEVSILKAHYICTKHKIVDEETKRTERMLHSMNEIYGYNLAAIKGAIYITGLIIILAMAEINAYGQRRD